MSAGRSDAPSAEELRLLQLAFVGEVLAVFVHEVNNRLATLQETVGLLGDLLGAAGAGKKAAVQESQRTAAGLEGQIALLAELTRQLDGFSRRLKNPGGGLDMRAALEELLALTARLARQPGIRIEKDFADRLPAVAVEPAVFLLLVQHLLRRAFALLPAQGVLRLRTRRGRGEGGIGLECSEVAGSEGLADGLARGLARQAGARLEEETKGTIMIWFREPA